MVIRLMKNFLTVLFIFSSKLAFPFEKFGGVYFDRTVPNSQAYAMKEDLKYLFKTDVLSFDTDLLKLLGTNDTSGETLYNWVYNRVRYIIGESYTIGGQNYISRGLLLSGFRYPKTPLPVIDRGDEYGASVVMSNVGASLYYNGKKQNELKGLRLDGKKVFAKSPRVGILQIGSGLFSDVTAINSKENSEANKIQRLGTLFHEARHSDGSGKNLGFFHKKCPSGHAFAGLFACESYNNGAYKLGALIRKAYLKKCLACSLEDKVKLEASIADALSRVVFRSHIKTEDEILNEIKTYEGVVKVYADLLALNPNETNRAIYQREYNNYIAKIKKCKEQLTELQIIHSGKDVNPLPEGEFRIYSKSETSSLIRNE